MLEFTNSNSGIGTSIERRSAPKSLVILFWLIFASSQIVLVEPAPYDIALIGLAFLACFFNLRLTPIIIMLAVTLTVNMCGQLLSAALSIEFARSSMFAATSIFLNLSAILIAIYIFSYPEKLVPALISGYTFAGVAAAIVGISAYFSLFGELSSEFLLYQRVKSTFKDPNVYGAFLVMPAVYCFNQVLTQPQVRNLPWVCFLLITVIGILLSFSRGAWLGLMLSSSISLVLVLINSTDHKIRLRILLISLTTVCLAAIMLSIVLGIEEVWRVFEIRFSAVQDYDVESGGRFSTQKKSILFILDHPFGLGFGDFNRYFIQSSPHNVYILMLLTSGWLGGIAYWILIALTLVKGGQLVLSPMSYPIITISLYSTFVSLMLMGLIVDTHHWRFFFMILGVIWALIAIDLGHHSRLSKFLSSKDSRLT